MTVGHPSYQNPIVSEALCEIHFRLRQGTDWNSAFFGRLFEELSPDFPDFEPVTQVGLQVLFGPQGMGPAIRAPQPRMRYKHASDKWLVQLSENIFTVNILSIYPGWAQMRADILLAWDKACAVITPADITRIGLRYINRIVRSGSDDAPGEWLNATAYLPQAALESLPGFLSRLEVRFNVHDRLIVTLAETSAKSDTDTSAIVFDIDRIVERDMDIDAQALGKEIDRLHEEVWQVFSASLTQRLDRHMKGDQP